MNVFIILATHDRSRHYEVLTFDDGYRDNLSVASDPLPQSERCAVLLWEERHGCSPVLIAAPSGLP